MKTGDLRPETRDISFQCYVDGVKAYNQKLFDEDEISVFESLRIYNGKIFRFEEHLKRLVESAHACGLQLPSAAKLRVAVEKAIFSNGSKNGFIRLTIFQEQVYVMIGERKHKPEIYETGVDLKTSSFRMPSPKAGDVQSKTGNYRLQLLDSPESKIPSLRSQVSGLQSFEYLFLDENHFLTESRVGNFFIVKKGQILTPPAHSVLNGITRDVVIECALESGFLVQEIPLTRHEAFNADEAFLTNTSWEILPVRSLDGRFLKQPIPGLVTRKLIQCFQAKVKKECRLEKSAARLSLSRTKKV